MKAQEGKIGRVFVLAFEHNEELLEPLIKFIKEKNIRAGFIQLLGAIQSGKVVCGPKETKIPPEPIYKEIKEAQEVVAVGSIFWEGDTPKVHLHAALGRGDKTILGCIREAARTFITLEVLVQEIVGVDLKKKFNPATGLVTL